MQTEVLSAEIRVLWEQQIAVAAPQVASFLRAIGRVVDVPPNAEEP